MCLRSSTEAKLRSSTEASLAGMGVNEEAVIGDEMRKGGWARSYRDLQVPIILGSPRKLSTSLLEFGPSLVPPIFPSDFFSLFLSPHLHSSPHLFLSPHLMTARASVSDVSYLLMRPLQKAEHRTTLCPRRPRVLFPARNSDSGTAGFGRSAACQVGMATGRVRLC